MVNTGLTLTIIVIVVVIMALIWFLMQRSARNVNLTRRPKDQKPEWVRTSPTPETIAATQADGEDAAALYDYDEGEKLAAPFAEQIEDVLRSQMSADPYLKSLDVDFGTGSDGGLEIQVGDKVYQGIDQIPDVRLREAITRAVETYNQRGK